MLRRPKGGRAPGPLPIGDRDYIVEEIIEQWYGPDDSFYKARADDGKVYLLRRRTSTGAWSI